MRHRQQGMSYIGVILLLGIAGGLIKIATVVAPPYLEYFTMDKAIRSMFRDTQTDGLTAAAAKSALSTRFEINNIQDQSPGDLVYTKDGNKLVIDLNYEVRRHLAGNIDVVIHFQNTYSSDSKSGNE